MHGNAPSLEDRQATRSLAHTDRKGQLCSGSAMQSWQPALAYLNPFTINTLKLRADSQQTGKVMCPWINGIPTTYKKQYYSVARL